ncbi:Hyalin [Holothuria leucospilota]|uniref:Hyalin n=1 Tax=Holothuria leucospilota TaxID=206669 RepID=A0A9Q1HJN7_HOLLE|nr:Hyalin [Holothuria leucospilota]
MADKLSVSNEKLSAYHDQHAPQAHCPPEVTLYIPQSSKQTELQFSANCSDNSGEIIKPNCTRQQNGEFLSLVNNLETVTCTCTDKSSNFDQCDFTVGVRDQHAPQAHCPPEVTLYIPQSSKQTELQFSANCSDNSGEMIKPNCTRQQNGEFLSLDNNLEAVTCTCTDKSSNFDRCNFTVGVRDQHAPQAHCPPEVTLYIPQSSKQTELQFSANCSDNSGEIIKPNCTRQQNGEFLSLDNNLETVTCTCTDKSSNFDQCDFTVGVRDQHVPQAHCPPEVTLYIPQSSKQTELQFSANCSDNSGEIIKPNCTRQQNGEFLSLDNNLETVTCTCTDKSSNFDQCNFTVGVRDRSPPEALCPDNVRLFIPDSANEVQLQFTATCTDNSGQQIEPNCTRPLNGSSISLADDKEIVICTCMDYSDNHDYCNFTVSVMDRTTPIPTCPGDMLIFLSNSTNRAMLEFSATCTDNSQEQLQPNCTRPPDGSVLFLADSPEVVRCACTDASGNDRECNFTVTVKDKTKPTATCESDIRSNRTIVPWNANCTDNTGEVKPAVCNHQGNQFVVGNTSVTCTCTDTSNNTDVCSFTVSVDVFCPEESFETVKGSLHFPATKVNQSAYSVEKCYSSNTSLAVIRCNPSIDGAALWGEPETQKCVVSKENIEYRAETFKENLRNVTAKNVAAMVSELKEITESSDGATAFIEEAGDVLQNISNVNSTSPEVTIKFIEVVGNFMNNLEKKNEEGRDEKVNEKEDKPKVDTDKILKSIETQLRNVQSSSENLTSVQESIAVNVVHVTPLTEAIAFINFKPKESDRGNRSDEFEVKNGAPNEEEQKEIHISIVIPIEAYEDYYDGKVLRYIYRHTSKGLRMQPHPLPFLFNGVWTKKQFLGRVIGKFEPIFSGYAGLSPNQ